MLIVDKNKVIETPIIDLIKLLEQQVAISNTHKLGIVRYGLHDVMISCPIHKNGMEEKPSCGVLLEDDNGISAGFAHCFTCQYKASFPKLVADCLNISYLQAVKWLLSVSKYSLLEDTRDVGTLELAKTIQDTPTVSIDELNSYEYVHDYMFKRKLTWKIIKKFDVGYDKELDAITFPVWVNGNCQFVCKRRVAFKRFDMPPISPKPVYGLDYITSNEVIVCESIINALYLWSLGYQAVALFGTGTDYQYEQLRNTDIRCFVLCFDGDSAGRDGAKRFRKALGHDKMIETIHMINNKDANDLTEDEFRALYDNRTLF